MTDYESEDLDSERLGDPEEITDDQSAVVARDIAQRIESELAYPGQIKVTVIRETRAVDYAK